MSYEKSNRIVRIKFEDKTTINEVQQCLYQAHYYLIFELFKQSLKNFCNKIFNLFKASFFLFIFTIISTPISPFEFGILFSIILGLSAAICLPSLYLYHYINRTRKIKLMIEKSDVSVGLASRIYASEANALFAAYTHRNEIVSVAGILCGDEKQMFKKDWNPQLEQNEALLVHVGTKPQHQGKGMARALVGECINFARSKNVKNVRLNTGSLQVHALNMYTKLGFKIKQTQVVLSSIDYSNFMMNLKLT